MTRIPTLLVFLAATATASDTLGTASPPPIGSKLCPSATAISEPWSLEGLKSPGSTAAFEGFLKFKAGDEEVEVRDLRIRIKR